MKRNLLHALVIVWLMLFSTTVQAQGEAFTPVRNAIRGGSARELVQYFGTTVELAFYGDKQNYSATQAEFVMKDFFAKNPPSSFDFKHFGGSNEGTLFAAGQYVSKGVTYSMFVTMKSEQGKMVVNTIDFKPKDKE